MPTESGQEVSELSDADLAPAIDALTSASSVTVLCHLQPDADTIGSGLALAIALDRRNVPVQVSFAEPAILPDSLQTLPGGDFLVAPDEVADEVDLLVTVDCGSVGRLGRLRDRLDGARRTVVVDHHRSNTCFGEINVVDAAAESTASVIARLLDLMGAEIDKDVAHCLYAGLVTDTGSFRWVRPGTHALAERLLETGIDGGRIARALLDTHPFGWLPMLSRVLGSAELVQECAQGRGLVYAVVERSDVGDLRSEEVESVIDIVRTTSDAEVAAVFKEMPDGDATDGPLWSVSLRSKDSVDVSAVAAQLGGGGHRFAAGYTTRGPIAELVSALTDALD
ncbi:bifunctional oligoribonuclease/PAP phosphatase NrnA [Antrihabitans sp. YC3-6]|uniref:Bifunctional oligoribonuclease/PAP phosphatase NrnA n=1 Tax=Antrihabitans stalagmiti TaxID=2799499 RepID=A0A934NUH1_9NOCA|nr:bifunctional oligoribonuclease/PAP phosphatase NrnA [Antrihabitans stalagmiti]MBJ8341515.1 bifunctional oligoribonuclease/PAP phosphatase NrnA [Antrihabitans stalagmiti]